MDKIVGKKHFEYLDYAKGIGIFFVVLGHDLQLHSNMLRVGRMSARYIYAFHMPLFFIISGIGLFYKLHDLDSVDLRAETKRLTKRLLLPYLFWSAIYTFLSVGWHFIQGEPNWFMSMMHHGYITATGFGVAPLWFLAELFTIEVSFLWLWRILKCRKFRDSACVWGGVLVITAIISAECKILFYAIPVDDLCILLKYPLIALFRFFPSPVFLIAGFMFGSAFAKCHAILQKQTVLFFAAFLSGAVFWIFEHFSGNRVNMYRFQLGNVWVLFITGIFGSLTVLFFSMLLPYNLRFLRELGRESLHLMVLHYPPIPTLRMLVILLDPYSSPMTWLLETASTILFLCICIKCVLNPLRNWIAAWVANCRGEKE